MENKIEKKTSETILQKRMEIVIGGKTYQAAPPSIATLILASEAVSRLPHISLNPDKLVEECLSVAKDCSVLGEIVAILILGAKCIKEQEKMPENKSNWCLLRFKRRPSNNKKKELARLILEELTPAELQQILSKLLSSMQLADFFGTTTFLTEINLIRKTKVD